MILFSTASPWRLHNEIPVVTSKQSHVRQQYQASLTVVQARQVRVSEQVLEVSPINCRTIASSMTRCCRSDHHAALRRCFSSATSTTRLSSCGRPRHCISLESGRICLVATGLRQWTFVHTRDVCWFYVLATFEPFVVINK